MCGHPPARARSLPLTVCTNPPPPPKRHLFLVATLLVSNTQHVTVPAIPPRIATLRAGINRMRAVLRVRSFCQHNIYYRFISFRKRILGTLTHPPGPLSPPPSLHVVLAALTVRERPKTAKTHHCGARKSYGASDMRVCEVVGESFHAKENTHHPPKKT